jgi:large subunit ribosomal protein L2
MIKTLKFFNPTTSSQRQVIRLNDPNLRKKSLIKNHTFGLKRCFGRNHSGKITVRHKGGGHKRKYRKINFYRVFYTNGIVTSIEYDPNRTANIASIFDTATKKYFYIIAPYNLSVGDIVKSGVNLKEFNLGYSSTLEKIPEYSIIHCLSIEKNKPATITRAAGGYAFLLKKCDKKHSIVQIPSGKKLLLSSKCLATIGMISNEFNFMTKIGKAGRSRWLNKRPSVRGVAMNPVDHPNGGGEGKKSGKKYTPWGKPNYKKKIKSRKSKLNNKKIAQEFLNVSNVE